MASRRDDGRLFMTELLIMSRRCSEYLTTRNRIVSGERAAELIRDCRNRDVHFQCHKGSINGLNVHCRGVHEIAPDRAYRMAVAWKIPIREINPDELGVASCR